MEILQMSDEISESKPIVTEPCPKPIEVELSFMDHALNWLETISEDDANRFLNGITIDAALVLFKHFPDNQLVKEVLHSKV
jgi:hypothetical protein